jgi:DNA-binding LacI/PurR family transcriptional regulator
MEQTMAGIANRKKTPQRKPRGGRESAKAVSRGTPVTCDVTSDNGPSLTLASLSGSAEFLHRTVADSLRHRITAGLLAGGSKLPTLREIATEFNVSTMTVRQAIHTLEQEGHLYRIPRVGAFVRPQVPNVVAVQKMLAFAASDLTSAFEMGIARGIERACQKRGWAIQILDAQHEVELEKRNMLRLPDSGSQGAMVLPTWGNTDCVGALFRLQRSGFPVVMVDRIPAGLKADLVESDHGQGAYLATRHLLERGHSQVLMLTPPPLVSSIAARIQGYERALVDAGIVPRLEWKIWLDLGLQAKAFEQNRKWMGGYQAMMPVLAALPMPQAVFAVDPYTAWGVYEACRELGLRIPEDVSVVGFDESEISQAMRPPITMISQRTDEIGEAAVDLLEQRVGGGRSQEGARRSFLHTVIDVDLVVGESVLSLNGR